MITKERFLQNIDAVNQKIANTCASCGRNFEEIQLIAVSKTKPVEDIKIAIEAGQLHFGENRMQELAPKMETVSAENVHWHLIGNLQTNKIRLVAHRVDWIHSVDSEKQLVEIEKRAAQHQRVIKVLIQVNISGEPQKGGCEPDDISKLLDNVVEMKHISVCGLMGMATFTEDEKAIRKEFGLLRKCKEKHQNYSAPNIHLEHLSMGMSGDFEIAIEEGATMVRIGSALFGERN